MNWEAIGAIGESLGAIAVFITLGYLALQVQFARKEIGRSISQSRAEALRTVTLARANDPRLNSLTVRAGAGVGELPEGERFEFESRTRANYGGPTLARFWYDANKSVLNPDVVRYIEGLLATAD